MTVTPNMKTKNALLHFNSLASPLPKEWWDALNASCKTKSKVYNAKLGVGARKISLLSIFGDSLINNNSQRK